MQRIETMAMGGARACDVLSFSNILHNYTSSAILVAEGICAKLRDAWQARQPPLDPQPGSEVNILQSPDFYLHVS